MHRWRFKLLTALIIYFAGFATAIYVLAPASDKQVQRQSDNGRKISWIQSDKTQDFAIKFKAQMGRFLSFAEEKAVVAGDIVKAELARRKNSD